MTYEYGEATDRDVKQLEQLGPRLCANAVKGFGISFHPASWSAAVLSFLGRPRDRRMFVATEGMRVVGVHALMASSPFFNHHDLVVRTLTLWVRPEVRGKGVASALHRLAENWAKALNAKAMFAGVPHDYAAHAELGDDANPIDAERHYLARGYRAAEGTFLKEIR